ncbi:MarR family winged helix-turn-helix transcriptional regulator [Ramlibacter sp. Leaf400]|uniref:MarR family winged helix-turn-helix transcriptional regulator n=1 Tax=Ramlibacter sp. Leaf400 TaxID=1736365 RepID=UPI00138F0EBE|nr:MarR family winged helix-turn-helix transcriptional regulator [Ramlibacter sp. Leaf400]
MTAHAPERLITYRVSVLAQAISRLVDASVRQNLGLTSRQWRVLVILNRLGTSPSGEVARMANFDHSQVSRVAFELAEKGLITQASDPVDRRKQILALTPAAVECLRDGVPVSLEREARLRSRLSPADYDTFIRALGALEEEAQTMLEEIRGVE